MNYIELFGLPGAGKTTITNPVIEALREEGFRVAGLSEVYFRNCCDRNKTKVWFEIITSLKKYPVYFQIFLYGLSVSISASSVKFLLKFIFLVHQIMKTKEEGKYDIVLCEEGIIQHLSSLSYLKQLPDNKRLDEVMLSITKVINIEAINCVINIEECINRVNSREESSQRFSSKIPGSVLFQALKMKEKNLMIVANHTTSVHELVLVESIDDNKNKLLSLVKQIIA